MNEAKKKKKITTIKNNDQANFLLRGGIVANRGRIRLLFVAPKFLEKSRFSFFLLLQGMIDDDDANKGKT